MKSSMWSTLFNYYLEQGLPRSFLEIMCITSEQADLIVSVMQQRKPKKVLEVGSFIGLSAGVLAGSSAPETTLTCVDPNLPLTIQARDFGLEVTGTTFEYVGPMLAAFGYQERVTLLPGFFACPSRMEFREKMKMLGLEAGRIPIVGNDIRAHGPFDLVFLDGDHYVETVYQDLLLIHECLAPQGLVILHDCDGSWAHEVVGGINRFLELFPRYSVSYHGSLGFLELQADW